MTKIENHVCRFDLSQRLKELGVKQNSVFHHMFYGHEERHVVYIQEEYYDPFNNICSAFTSSELGEMLPENAETHRFEGQYNVRNFEIHMGCERVEYSCWDKTEADARAKMIIHLIEDGVLKP